MALGTSACFLLTFTPHRKVLLKRRCERKKITKETKKKVSFCLLPTLPPPLRGKRSFGCGPGKLPWNKALTCPEPLRHCTACLWVRPHRLTPSTCKSRSPGRGTDVMSPSSWGCRKDSSGRPLPSAPPRNLKEGQGAKLGGVPPRPEDQLPL